MTKTDEQKKADAHAERQRHKTVKGGIKNAEFAKDKNFIDLCEAAGVKPTKRQASKYRSKRGAAYRHKVSN